MEMEPLATTRRMLTWLCMCPADELSTLRQKLPYVAHTSAILLIHLVSFVASVVFCVKHIKNDFNGATFAFMICIGEVGLVYSLIVGIFMCHQIGDIFTHLSTIYKSSELNH